MPDFGKIQSTVALSRPIAVVRVQHSDAGLPPPRLHIVRAERIVVVAGQQRQYHLAGRRVPHRVV